MRDHNRKCQNNTDRHFICADELPYPISVVLLMNEQCNEFMRMNDTSQANLFTHNSIVIHNRQASAAHALAAQACV